MVQNTQNIETILQGLQTEFGNFQVKEVTHYGHDLYHVGAKGFSLILWDKKNKGIRSELVLGSMEVYTSGKGLGKKIINTLARYAMSAKYSRIVANKAENPEFLMKRGFIQDDVFPQDYVLPLSQK